VSTSEPHTSSARSASSSSNMPDAPPPIQLRVQGRTVTLRESQALTGEEWDKLIEILKILRPAD